jgi:hypothetical protein
MTQLGEDKHLYATKPYVGKLFNGYNGMFTDSRQEYCLDSTPPSRGILRQVLDMLHHFLGKTVPICNSPSIANRFLRIVLFSDFLDKTTYQPRISSTFLYLHIV